MNSSSSRPPLRRVSVHDPRPDPLPPGQTDPYSGVEPGIASLQLTAALIGMVVVSVLAGILLTVHWYTTH